ncbi:MAG: MFS transporter [Gemmatimonadetes bacterium]|nr:MAG: MFS transporter [Gemmatimonadota bacterium]
MSVWLTASAVGAELAARWDLDAEQVALLTTVVQLGFVLGTAIAALLNLADIVPARAYFAASAAAAALANAAVLVAPGFGWALVARLLTGFFLAGVYPPSMKMMATWFRAARGMAIGAVVGALTIGKATPYVLKLIDGAALEPVLLGSSAGALLGGVLVGAFYRDGPYPFPRTRFSWGLVGRVVRDRPTRLATGGYLGHMWELYAAWASIGLFFDRVLGHGPRADLAAFAMIAAGGPGAYLAGRWADAWGRERTTIWMMAISGSCALTLGWLTGGPTWLVVGLALVWGFTIVADSAQFSAVVTEVAPADAVGTALTLQTSVGFLLTTVSIQLVAGVADRVGWGPAYAMLAVGPVLGIVSMVRLRRLRAAR